MVSATLCSELLKGETDMTGDTIETLTNLIFVVGVVGILGTTLMLDAIARRREGR